MPEFWHNLTRDLINTSGLEWVAGLLAIAYLLLAIREHIACWYAAFASTLIYTVIFFDIRLYMESLLNIYYLGMTIYGWKQWRRRPADLTNHAVKPVISWSWKIHLGLVSATAAVALGNGYLLAAYSDASFPYLDSLTTWFAVVTTYLVTQKELQNWLYWIIIDAVSIGIYLQKGIALTAVIFAAYIVIAVFGWLAWRRHLRAQATHCPGGHCEVTA